MAATAAGAAASNACPRNTKNKAKAEAAIITNQRRNLANFAASAVSNAHPNTIKMSTIAEPMLK